MRHGVVGDDVAGDFRAQLQPVGVAEHLWLLVAQTREVRGSRVGARAVFRGLCAGLRGATASEQCKRQAGNDDERTRAEARVREKIAKVVGPDIGHQWREQDRGSKVAAWTELARSLTPRLARHLQEPRDL